MLWSTTSTRSRCSVRSRTTPIGEPSPKPANLWLLVTSSETTRAASSTRSGGIRSPRERTSLRASPGAPGPLGTAARISRVFSWASGGSPGSRSSLLHHFYPRNPLRNRNVEEASHLMGAPLESDRPSLLLGFLSDVDQHPEALGIHERQAGRIQGQGRRLPQLVLQLRLGRVDGRDVKLAYQPEGTRLVAGFQPERLHTAIIRLEEWLKRGLLTLAASVV